MNRVARWTAVTFTIFIISFSLQAHSDTTPTQRYIEISGRGVIHETPDIAILSLTFSERHKQASYAKTTVDNQVEKFLEFSKQLNIKTKDIQAARISIYPEYDYKNNRQLIGYRVSRDVQVQIRNLLNYPKLLEGAVDIGATNTGQLQLDFSNRKVLENKALQAAYIDAKAQAKFLAEVSGDTLGKALWIQASAGHKPVPMRMTMMSEMKADANYPTGEISLTRQVQVRFELQD